jgi:hypothetical protein
VAKPVMFPLGMSTKKCLDNRILLIDVGVGVTMGVKNRFLPRAVTRCFSSLDNRPHGGRRDTKVRIGRTHLRQHLSTWRCTYFAWGCFAKQSGVPPRGGALGAQFGRYAPRVQSPDLATVGRGAVTVTALGFLFALLRLCRVSSPWSQCANRARDRSPQRADQLAAPLPATAYSGIQVLADLNRFRVDASSPLEGIPIR